MGATLQPGQVSLWLRGSAELPRPNGAKRDHEREREQHRRDEERELLAVGVPAERSPRMSTPSGIPSAHVTRSFRRLGAE